MMLTTVSSTRHHAIIASKSEMYLSTGWRTPSRLRALLIRSFTLIVSLSFSNRGLLRMPEIQRHVNFIFTALYNVIDVKMINKCRCNLNGLKISIVTPYKSLLLTGLIVLGFMPKSATPQSASNIEDFNSSSTTHADEFSQTNPTESTSQVRVISLRPSILSSTNPSYTLTTSNVPTVNPMNLTMPSVSPSIFMSPSAAPSQNETIYIERDCSQILELSQNLEFNDVELQVYCLQMQSYTDKFGNMVSLPFIKTTCKVIDQVLAGGRRQEKLIYSTNPLQLRWPERNLQTTTKTLLVIQFMIKYETNYGYDILNYPSQFQSYINSNLDLVTQDMQARFLPVTSVQEVIVYNTKTPTESPSAFLIGQPIMFQSTFSPSLLNMTADADTLFLTDAPSFIKVNQSLSPRPSISSAPFIVTQRPKKAEIVDDRRSFIAGLAAGLTGAAFILMLCILYTQRTRRKNDSNPERSARMSLSDKLATKEISYDLKSEAEVKTGDGRSKDEGQFEHEIIPFENPSFIRAHSPGAAAETITSIISNPSMVSDGGSYSSNPNDIHEVVPLNQLQDEFDSYKNQDVEFIRNGMEESVYGVEGMMSMAMSRALMEEDEVDFDLSWGGAEDSESMEANIMCETNDWLRKNDHASLQDRMQFFQDILNRMVITVRRGMIRPHDGTRAMHCCAAMLGIQLEKELPNNVLLVYGMRKTHNLSQGRFYLVEAFKSFGDIESAGIAPNNRGFGFVRFAHPKSVDRAFDRFRVSEIEVQDVSIMMKTLKSDDP